MKLLKLIVISCCFYSAMVFAHGNAKEKNPYIVHRQGIYAVAAGHMEALKSIIMRRHPAKEDVGFHAKGMLEAFKHHGDAYPAGSDKGHTRAKGEIWTDPEGFKQAGEAAGKAIVGLIEAAASNDEQQIKTSFGEVGKTCKGCHDDYRKKTD